MRLKAKLGLTFALLFVASLCIPALVSAQKNDSGFSLQVSPSPIIENIKPGESSMVEVIIRNTGTQQEQLKMGLRSFKVSESGNVQLNDEAPKDVAEWVSFSDPNFDVDPGKSFVQKVTFATPVDAGFSYSFAIMVSRQKPTAAAPGKPAIEGSVAIFTLLSVDKPGATRKIDMLQFSSLKNLYEYVPATFSLKLKNSGNSIVKPTGTVFIQRSTNSSTPIASLQVNESGAYILPDVSRSVDVSWSDGFPYYKTNSTNGKKSLSWNIGSIEKFRIGKYYARAVVVYNDGVRDVPVQAVVSFWVFPWKLLLGVLVLVILVFVGLFTTILKTARITRKKNREKSKEA